MGKIYILIFIIWLFIVPFNSFAQTNIHIGYYKGNKIVAYDLHNLVTIMQMSFTEFSDFMKGLNYDKPWSTRPEAYVSEFDASEPIFIVGKKTGSAYLMWTADNYDINKLKDELQPYFYKMDGEKAIYHLNIENIKYNVYLHDGSVTINQLTE